jgi:hypothetical protein
MLINGSLVSNITMSNIKMISCKKDIYFSADHESFVTSELILAEKHFNTTFLINPMTNLSITTTSNNESSTNLNINNSNSTAISPAGSPKETKTSFFSPTTPPTTTTTTTVTAKPVQIVQKEALSSKTSDPLQSSSGHPEMCTIYKIDLNFLNRQLINKNKGSGDKNSSKSKIAENIVFNQLCETSKRTIQREINNMNPRFLFNDQNFKQNHKNSIYKNIINSNVSIFFLILKVKIDYKRILTNSFD